MPIVDDSYEPATPPTPVPSEPPGEGLLRELVEGYAIIRLPVRGFDTLELREKILAYHLYQASLAGRDITYDQDHEHALAIRQNLEAVLDHNGQIPGDLLDRIRTYAKLFWIANGPYHMRTKRKIAPGFTAGEWEAALDLAASAGARLVRDAAHARVMFDPEYLPLMTNKNPGAGRDPLQESGVNYYDGVTLADLEGFEERNALNSRLVKREGVVMEEVYRAGRAAAPDQQPAPAGRYAAELKAVCVHLRAAIPFAGEAQQATLRHLVEHFETGSLQAFDRSNVAWLADNPRVDLILGFIEAYKDPRGIKGEWEGVVSMVDAEASRLMRAVAESAAYFEQRAPWDAQYKRTEVRIPVAKAIQVIVGHGGAGPTLPTGINLPNSNAIRETHGSKSFLLTNVLRAIDGAVADAGLAAFALPEERGPAREHGPTLTDVHVALHEIVGHGSGKLSEAIIGKDPAVFLKELANALEEARAELVALHHIWDPRMREIAPTCGEECAEAAYRAYARNDLMNLRRVTGDRIEDDHMRATHLIVQYARHRGVVELRKVGGVHYQVVSDVPGMRKVVAELLTEVMRIKAEGDYESARKLFEAHGMHFAPALRDEVTARARRAGLPKFYAYVMPELRAERDASGRITNVVVHEVADFEAQMRRWSALGL